mgnify:FL=1
MVFFVGVVVGGYGLTEPASYELTACERGRLVLGLRGLPMSVQHAGVREAVFSAGLSECGLTGAGMRTVLPHAGVVRDAWMPASDPGAIWILFEVFDDYDLVLWLVLTGHLQGLSLSHVGSGPDDVTPVEVALCSVPARPHCVVRHRCTTFQEAFEYKAQVVGGAYSSLEPFAMSSSSTSAPLPSAAAAAAEPASSRLEAVLASLSAADASLVQARFSEMMARVDDATASEESAKTRLEQLVAIKDTDRKMFEEQFSHLLSFLPAPLQKSYAVTGETCKVLQNAAPEVLHHVGQVVKCASAHFAAEAAAASSSSGPRGTKRGRFVDTFETVVPAAAATVAAPPSSVALTPLQRALADTFSA